MLTIFAFFSIASTLLVTCLSIALVNVVIRRETAYLVEERIKIFVDNKGRLDSPLPGQSYGRNGPGEARPAWLHSTDFADIVDDRGKLGLTVLQAELLKTLPIEAILEQVSKEAGVKMSSNEPELLSPYRVREGLLGEVKANFIPGSRRPVPAVIVVRNWQTGARENWVVCEIRPSYSRTVQDLGRMGLRRASWVSPFASIAAALIVVYAAGLLLAIRLSQRIVTVIDALSSAAIRVGKGDFTPRVAVREHDQLGKLAASFNEMTIDLEKSREQERQQGILKRDLEIAREVQQHLYPRVTPNLPGASVGGMTTPARIVSGDLYDFFSLEEGVIGLLCADISGKGVSAALMMAHLQAVAHNRLLGLAPTIARPSPASFVDLLNRDLRGRFGDNRYATMLYGEFNSDTRVFRYVNAGHCPPILANGKHGTIQLLEGNVPVGLFPGAHFEEHRITVPSGSTLLVYTDGVTEAANSSGEDFGTQRLVSFCASLPSDTNASSVCNQLIQRIADWSSATEQADDITVLALSLEQL